MIQSLEKDLEDVKQSNLNFANQNKELMVERDDHVASINTLNGQITELQKKVQQITSEYRELLSAKEVEQDKWNRSVQKLFSFKDRVVRELEHAQKARQESEQISKQQMQALQQKDTQLKEMGVLLE